jgi:hypothetical protein
MALFVVTLSNYIWSGAESAFVRPEAYTVSGAIFKTKNTKLGTKVNMYLKWEKKSQQITNLKNLTNTTNITKSRKKHYLFIN